MAMQWLGWASEHSGDGATISRDFTMELLWAGGRGASHLKRCSEHPVLVLRSTISPLEKAKFSYLFPEAPGGWQQIEQEGPEQN